MQATSVNFTRPNTFRPARLLVAAAALSMALAALATLPAHGAEAFDADCQWDAERGNPEPLVITGFATGSAQLSPEKEAEITAYADGLNAFSRICVTGQADKRGSYEFNDRLAMKRARAVAARLIAAGVDPIKLSLSSRAEAFGAEVPPWFWSAGNRRVEVVVME